MLEPANVGVLRRKFDLVALPTRHGLDRLARLLEGLVLRAAAQVDDTGKRTGDLARRVAPSDVDRDARGLGVAEARRLASVVVLQGQNDVGVLGLADDRDGQTEAARRILDTRPRHAERIHLDRLAHAVVQREAWRATALDRIGRRPSRRLRRASDLATLGARADLRRDRHPQENGIDHLRHVVVDRDALVRLDLDQHLERRWSLTFEHRLLRTAAPRFFVGERDGLDPADEVRQGRVEHEVFQSVAMRGRDQLHATLGDRARGGGFLLGPDLVDDHDLGHVVLDRLDHDRMLEGRRRHLHAPRAADAGMWDVAVASDLVRGVDDDDALREVIGEDARDFAQHRRLADAGPTEKQDAPPRLDDVADDLDGPVDGAADAEGEPDDFARAVPQRADAMQRSLDAGAIVAAELPDVRDDIREVLGG